MSDGVTIGISSSELAKFQQQLKHFTDAQKKKITSVVTQSGFNMRSKAFSKAPRVFSVLANSINVKIGKEGLAVRVGASADYAPFVEFGTKSHVSIPPELAEYASQFKNSKQGSFDDLLESVKLWAKRKGLPPESAYPIAVKIAKYGIHAKPFLYPAFKEEKERFLQRLKQALQ